jgi:hypothetical protein
MSLDDEKRQANMEVIARACGGSTFDEKLGLSGWAFGSSRVPAVYQLAAVLTLNPPIRHQGSTSINDRYPVFSYKDSSYSVKHPRGSSLRKSLRRLK